MTEWGCLRMSESALKGDTSGPRLVENYCTMSSLLMPISFVPKLRTSDERGRERSTSPPHGTPPATLETFITSNLTISSKHSGKESRCGHTIVQTRKVGHREDEGLAQRGDAPWCLGCILGSDTLTHTVSLIWETASTITRILVVHSSLCITHHLCCISPNWCYIIFLPFLERSLLPIKHMVSRLQQSLFHLTESSERETPKLVQSNRKSLEH